jgi:homoserine kinase type II
MAQFRILTPADLQEILVAFGFAESDYLGHTPIAAGTINTNVRVDTATGPRFLRVNEGKSEDDVAHEAAILAHLVASGVGAGVPTPRPISAVSGLPYLVWRDHFVSLFPWVSGRVLHRGELEVGHVVQVGRALARLHLRGASFGDHRPGRYEPDELARRLVQIRAHVTGVAHPDRALGEALATLEPALARLGEERARAPVPLGLIHGDLFVDNVLFSVPASAPAPGAAVGDAALVALLDFEQASWGRWIYDVAVTLLAFAFGRADFRMDLVRAFLDGYQAERRLGDAEAELLGTELRFAACRFAVTRITDVYLKRSAGAPAGKDFRRYLARLACVEAHLTRDPRAFL